MQQYKRIGILGGISPQSSALFYKKIIEKHYQEFQDHYYPEIVIPSLIPIVIGIGIPNSFLIFKTILKSIVTNQILIRLLEKFNQ